MKLWVCLVNLHYKGVVIALKMGGQILTRGIQALCTAGVQSKELDNPQGQSGCFEGCGKRHKTHSSLNVKLLFININVSKIDTSKNS